MTLASHEMSHQEQEDFFEAIDRINRAGAALKVIAWALGGLAVAGLAVAAWVWKVNGNDEDQEAGIARLEVRATDIERRAGSLETWITKHDASPRVSMVEVHGIDKRLARVEEQLANVREQNAFVIETLRKIENQMR